MQSNLSNNLPEEAGKSGLCGQVVIIKRFSNMRTALKIEIFSDLFK